MTTAFATNRWNSPAVAHHRVAGWRFARELQQGGGWLFELKRNVSMSPRQLFTAFAGLSLLSGIVAAAFWWNGVSMVVVFTAIELLAVSAALLIAARHAGDRELITLANRALAVEQRCGSKVDRATFRAEWVRVEPARGEGSLIELSGEGRSVRVGRYVRPELRVELAHELRRALTLLRSDGLTDLDHEHKA